MDNTIISLSHYQVNTLGGGSGFMVGNQGEMAELRKAMVATEQTGRELADVPTSGASLKVESLENTLKVLTFKDSDIVLWKKIPKLPAYNTVEEYNQLTDYGAERGGFNNEGELPEEEDSTFIRRSQLVKFLGTTRQISHPMQLVSTMVGDVVQQQIQHGTLWILRKVNKALAFGDSSIVPQEFNGLYKQHMDAFNSLDEYYSSSSVVDCKGKKLSESNIEDAELSIIENYGEGTLLMAPPVVLSNFVKNFYSSKLIQPNTAALTDGVMGQRVNTFMSQFGSIDLVPDKFLKSPVGKKTSDAATSAKAPNKPNGGGAPAAAVADASQNWSGFEGDYWYAVTAINRYGESALQPLGAGAITVSPGESVDLQFTDAGGVIPATGYTIYKSLKDAAGPVGNVTFYPLFTINKAQVAAGYDGAAATKVRDKNRILPNTNTAFLIEPDLQVFSFKQLAPLMKMDLAPIGPATRFMVLLYGTPILYAPKKMTKFVNIGNG